MTPKEFLVQKLESVVSNNSDLKIRYSLDTLTDIHVVQLITPKISTFKSVKSSLLFDFLEVFPYETISFDSEDLEEKFEELVTVLTGSSYTDKLDWTSFNQQTQKINSDTIKSSLDNESVIKYVLAS